MRNLVKGRGLILWQITCAVLITWSAFNLGRLSQLERWPDWRHVKFRPNLNVSPAESQLKGSGPKDLKVVVSRKSKSRKFHYAWCPGAITIKESNQKWFSSASIAQQAGYTLAANCTF